MPIEQLFLAVSHDYRIYTVHTKKQHKMAS